MTPDTVPSVQSTTDVALLKASTFKTTILPLTPSDHGTTSIEDDPVSRAEQEGSTTFNPTPAKNNSVATEEVTARDPIILVDPLGALWILPFESAKTWEV